MSDPGPVQQVRFCEAPDGARIAYAISGTGPPMLVSTCWLSHLQHDWAAPDRGRAGSEPAGTPTGAAATEPGNRRTVRAPRLAPHWRSPRAQTTGSPRPGCARSRRRRTRGRRPCPRSAPLSPGRGHVCPTNPPHAPGRLGRVDQDRRQRPPRPRAQHFVLTSATGHDGRRARHHASSASAPSAAVPTPPPVTESVPGSSPVSS